MFRQTLGTELPAPDAPRTCGLRLGGCLRCRWCGSPPPRWLGGRFGPLAHHRMPHRAFARRPRRSPAPFSPALRVLGGRAQLSYNPAQPAPYLGGRGRSRAALPRSPVRDPGGLGQDHLVAHGFHQICPELELLGRAQVRLGPQQVLLAEAEAVLLAIAPPILRHHFRQRQLLPVHPAQVYQLTAAWRAVGTRSG